MREKHLKVCTVCKSENYIGTRNKTKQPEKQEVMKFCPKCNKHTLHKEKAKFK